MISHENYGRDMYIFIADIAGLDFIADIAGLEVILLKRNRKNLGVD
jgi:hypothetical protein